MKDLIPKSLSDIMSNEGISLNERNSSITGLLKKYNSSRVVLKISGESTPLYISEKLAQTVDELRESRHFSIGLLNSCDEQINALEHANVISYEKGSLSRFTPVNYVSGPNYKNAVIVGVEVNMYNKFKNFLNSGKLSDFEKIWQPGFYRIESQL